MLEDRALLGARFFPSVIQELVKRLQHHLPGLFEGFTLRVGPRDLRYIRTVSAFIGWLENKRYALHRNYYTFETQRFRFRMTAKTTVDEVLAPKPGARPPRIYAYSIADDAHLGLLEVGQTTRDVKQRVTE